MAVTIHVNGKSNSLVHKGSMGIAKSTIPDVCKTPTPSGPVPIPYPVIVSMSSDLVKGTKKVKVDGRKSAAVKGSEFSRCTGDEPGTVGGIKSSTNMKEATWILYSFDVKLEGKNACRLSDKMLMNHGNTACLAGLDQAPVSGEKLTELIKKCDESKKVFENAKKANGGKDPKVETGTPSTGFGGEVDLKTGEITISDKNDGCQQIQTATFEMNRLAHKTEHENANKLLTSAGRTYFIKAQEKVGYDVIIDTHKIVESCKKEWGCEKTKSRYEWADDAKDFDDYFDNNLADRHKEVFGKWWDRANPK